MASCRCCETSQSSGQTEALKPGSVYKDFGGVVESWNSCINAADLKQGLVAIWTGGKGTAAVADKDLPKLCQIDNNFTVLNGLSRPKLITCFDGNGKAYTQIVKAGDDMRGDEVVEQVFSVVNSLLRKDHKCRRDRRLNIQHITLCHCLVM